MGQADTGVNTFAELVDLAGERLGGRAVACSDDFFAGRENLLKAEKAVFIVGKFTERGKWMDGWESRRKRTQGHDWCVVKLGVSGMVRGVNVDTSHFNGNQPEFCTVEGAELQEVQKGAKQAIEKAEWVEIVDQTRLGPSREHLIEATGGFGKRFTHVRLNIFPDGGVARLRVFGEVVADWAKIERQRGSIEMSSAKHGGLVVAANDMHFGSRHNLIMPDQAKNMGDGWETRRKRGLTWEGGQPREFDWAVVKLARRCVIQSIDVDTNHFKGNFPESCAIEGADVTEELEVAKAAWRQVLGRTKLKANTLHAFEKQLEKGGPVTHVRLKIYPDGGVSRLRVWGRPA